MKFEIVKGEVVAAIRFNENNLPLFKDEKKDNVKFFTPEFQKEVIKAAFEGLAKAATHSVLKPNWGKFHRTRQLRSGFYSSLAKVTNLKEEDIKSKIKDYVKENPERVLNIAREIAEKTGAKLENTKREELLNLVENPQTDIISFLLGEQPRMFNLHMANFMLAQLAAELFGINVTMRDVMIMYDHSFGGSALEQWRFEAQVSNTAPTIHFQQGFAVLTPGFVIDKEIKFYHIEPQELIKVEESRNE